MMQQELSRRLEWLKGLSNDELLLNGPRILALLDEAEIFCDIADASVEQKERLRTIIRSFRSAVELVEARLGVMQ